MANKVGVEVGTATELKKSQVAQARYMSSSMLKLFPSCANGPRRIGTDVFGDYLLWATWSFEAIGAFGRDLWPFSFRGSGRRLSSSALPWKGIFIEKKPLEPKLH